MCCTKKSGLAAHAGCPVLQNERVLFHYNGHGVPRPTVNGEIWVFNKSYTQYIPMSIYDLQAWLGIPCIFVFDCSAAGLIVNSFKAFAEQKPQVCATLNTMPAPMSHDSNCQTVRLHASPCQAHMLHVPLHLIVLSHAWPSRHVTWYFSPNIWQA